MFRKAAAKYRDFASFLDDLMPRNRSGGEVQQEDADERQERSQAAAPSLQVDLLDQLERLQGTSSSLADEPAMAGYREMAEALEEVAPRVGIVVEDPSTSGLEPSVDPDMIARELGIDGVLAPGKLARLRREFAMHNHPDRVPAELRERAEIRMRIANMLIDEAKSRASDRKR